MQIVLVGNRVVAHGDNCFLSMGGTVICEDTGKAYPNATVAEVDAIPADIDTVGYEYHAGVFVPCAPYGEGAGAIMVACEECGTPKRSKITTDADGGLNIPGYLTGGKVSDETASALGLETGASVDDALGKMGGAVLHQPVGRYTKVDSYGDLLVGTEVKLNVNGVAKDFIVVHQGNPDSTIYDESCNGTWLLMKDLYESRAWNSSEVNDYANSTIYSYLNGSFLGLLDANIQNAIKQAKIPYRAGSGYHKTVTSGENGLPTKVFLLSADELARSSYDNKPTGEGAALDYFASATGAELMAYLNGVVDLWWMRSPGCVNSWGSSHAVIINQNGETSASKVTTPRGVRPAFILDSETAWQEELYTDGKNYYTEQVYDGAITDVFGGLISIPGEQIVGGTKIATGSYTGTGTYGKANAITLNFDFKPKLVIVTLSNRSEYICSGLIMVEGATVAHASEFPSSYNSNYYSMITWGENSVSWYCTASDAIYMLNGSGYLYNYFAIG